MIDAKGDGALCRQGAEPEEARAELHAARRPVRPHRPRHRGDRVDGVRLDAHRDRGAAPRGEPDQAAPPALQRAPARRQVVPLHPDHRGPPGPGDRQASRRAQPEGHLFRSLRLGRRGRPHDQRAAARLPAPHLLGLVLREPDAALPPLPDQALLGALHRRDQHSATMPISSTRRRPSSPARARRCATEMQTAMAAAAERLDFEAAARLSRPPRRPLPHPGPPGHQPAAASRRPTSSPVHQDGGATCVQVFFFRTGQNWGNRAYFPRADTRPRRGRGARRLPRPVLRRQAGAEADPALARDRGARAARGGAVGAERPPRQRARCRSAARRRTSSTTRSTNAREALGRELAESASQKTLLAGLAERFGLAEPPRRIEVYDNSHIMGTNPVGAMIVAGPDGLRQRRSTASSTSAPRTSRPATTTP